MYRNVTLRMRVKMIKQIQIILILLVTCFWGRAGNNGNDDFHGDITSPAVRNSVKFNYDLIAGMNYSEQTNFSDDFNLPQLRSLWQTTISESNWSLKERPGFLRIKGQKITDIDEFLPENTFSQKVKYNTIGEAISYIDLSNLSENSFAGLYFSSKRINCIGVEANSQIKRLIAKVDNQVFRGPEISGNSVVLRIKIENTKGWFEYSFDGLSYTQLGSLFQLSALSTDFIGLYCLNESNGQGSIDVDWFYYNPKDDHVTKFAEIENKFLNSEL